MPDVPDEIWRYIAQFVPKHILRNMYEVNSTFFDMAMNERYGDISCYRLDSRLLKIWSSPSIRSRIRIFRVRTYFIQELIYIQTGHSLDSRNDLTSPTVVSLFSLLQNLPNLQEYHIQWDDLPTTCDLSLQLLIQPFLSPNNLRKVSLAMELEKLNALISSLSRHTSLDHLALEELSLTVRHEGQVFNGPTHAHTLQSSLTSDLVASFIIQSQGTDALRSLTLEFTHTQDFSPLFRALAKLDSKDRPLLPKLQSLTLSIPTPSPQIGDPRALASFISVHFETLTHLKLQGQWEHYFELGLSGPPSHSLDAYIEECLLKVTLPNLASLSIATTSYSMTTALRIVSRFTRTLRELDLTGSYMNVEDMEELVRVFRPPFLFGPDARSSSLAMSLPLKILHTGPLSLSPQLVDLLAEGFPGLRELNIRVRDVLPHKDDQPLYHGLGRFIAGRKLRTQKQEQIDAFFQQMRTRLYTEWKLERIGVWKFNTKLQFQPQYAMLFAKCVPSVKFPESVHRGTSISSSLSVPVRADATSDLPPLSEGSSSLSPSSPVPSPSSSASANSAAPQSPPVSLTNIPTVCGWCAHGSTGESANGNGPVCGC